MPTSSRAAFARTLASEAASGKMALLLAPLGAGKTHTLLQVGEALRETGVPFIFIDLFTAASTPERLLLTLASAVSPYLEDSDQPAVQALAEECARDRHNSSACLLRLFDLLETHATKRPFVWLIDEVTEIRSLAYFPDLGHIERPFQKAVSHARGALVTSSYMGLAVDLFPEWNHVPLPGLTTLDLDQTASLRSDGTSVGTALEVTSGFAATLRPLLADMNGSRDTARSLASLLSPGGALELLCRRHYEVLLMRSRGYAVCKRAAEVVARARFQRLTDLFPHIGRTAGASRQYLRWLVEVGLLTQVRKRYDFADPVLGLWASLYLGRGTHPDRAEIEAAVEQALLPREAEALVDDGAHEDADDIAEPESELPRRRADRFEEID